MDQLLRLNAFLSYWTSWVKWEAWGTFVAVAVVLLALWPIFQGWKRDHAHARSLRIRIGALLVNLNPTLEDWKNPERGTMTGSLSPRQFQQVISDLHILMKESPVLEVEEQDQLAVVLGNLSALAVVYQNGTSGDMLAETAGNQRKVIDDLQAIFSKHGILSGSVDVPWGKEETNEPNNEQDREESGEKS